MSSKNPDKNSQSASSFYHFILGAHVFTNLAWPLRFVQFILFFLQRGSFVSNGVRYFVEPSNDGKMNTSAHFRKFHLVFRHSTVREGFSNAPSTCGLVGKLNFKAKELRV